MEFCKKGHPLVWNNTTIGYSEPNYVCDICRNSFPSVYGRWNCMGCKYDVCQNCSKPQPIQMSCPVSAPISTAAFIQCKNCHPLQWSKDSTGYMDTLGYFSCDACKQACHCACGRWCCLSCKYDICQTCRPSLIAPPMPAPMPSPPISFATYTQCQNGHSLQWNVDASGHIVGTFTCASCNKSYDCSFGGMCCTFCKFDLCPYCKQAQPELASMSMPLFRPMSEQRPMSHGMTHPVAMTMTMPMTMPMPMPMPMTSFVQCRNAHPLQWSNDTSGYMMGTFSCEACKKTNPCTYGRWCCLFCHYDICQSCRPQMPGTASLPMPATIPMTGYIQCRSGHPLNFTNDSTGYMGGQYGCDACKSFNSCSFGRWCCIYCKYDICTNCRPSAGTLESSPDVIVTIKKNTDYSQCKSGHPLQWSNDSSGYPMKTYMCDVCKSSGSCGFGRWCCLFCHYDLCQSCRPGAGSCSMPRAVTVHHPQVTATITQSMHTSSHTFSSFSSPPSLPQKGEGHPTALVGGHSASGAQTNDYTDFGMECLEKGKDIVITAIDLWTNPAKEEIVAMQVKYEIPKYNGA